MYEKELVYKIRGIIFDIYNNIAGNWSENDYEDVLFDALQASGIKVERQKEFEVLYKGNRVGLYRTDLIAEDKIILELKAVPEIFPLHEAQTISYLKATGLLLGLLINFSGPKLYIKAFPNKNYRNGFNKNDVVKNSFMRQLEIDFDINKVNLPINDQRLIYPFLVISKEILEILGLGFFHQIYRRAFWDELKYNNIDFEWMKQLELRYKNKIYNKKDVKFFKINDLLISIVAVRNLNSLTVNQFSKYVKYYSCSKGLIVNFNNQVVDFRYLK